MCLIIYLVIVIWLIIQIIYVLIKHWWYFKDTQVPCNDIQAIFFYDIYRLAAVQPQFPQVSIKYRTGCVYGTCHHVQFNPCLHAFL